MHKILLIHPDRKLVQLYTPHLQRHFQLDSASDGMTGLRKIKLYRPNLVVSDYYLPLLSGRSLLKFIRNSQNFQKTPFIFLSNHENSIEALSLGANDWCVQNTTNPETLINKIYSHIKINAIQIN